MLVKHNYDTKISYDMNNVVNLKNNGVAINTLSHHYPKFHLFLKRVQTNPGEMRNLRAFVS